MSAKKSKSGDVPGNTMAEARAWAKRVHSYGIALLKLDRLTDPELRRGAVITSIKVLKPTAERSDWLVVVKGREGGRNVVGFHSALDPSEAVRVAIEKFDNRSMKLREDKPYKPQG